MRYELWKFNYAYRHVNSLGVQILQNQFFLNFSASIGGRALGIVSDERASEIVSRMIGLCKNICIFG